MPFTKWGPAGTSPSSRSTAPSLNENLLESELFGHAKGAYTGADSEQASAVSRPPTGAPFFWTRSAIFPRPPRSSCCASWKKKRSSVMGEHTPVKVDVRIVSASNRDPENS
jgi:DNA-binding NtrC family response regulator